jgi:hypothetical protein
MSNDDDQLPYEICRRLSGSAGFGRADVLIDVAETNVYGGWDSLRHNSRVPRDEYLAPLDCLRYDGTIIAIAFGMP